MMRTLHVGSGVIRVDIGVSVLSSAIHNTGHYHGRPRPVCLPPSCARSANNWHSRRSPCVVLASLDLRRRVPKIESGVKRRIGGVWRR
jgi:hypothetical protein